MKAIKINFKIAFLAVIGYYLFISCVYAVMSLVNHSHYQTFIDLGIYSQGIWQYSCFQFPYTTFYVNGPFLSNHFHPILILLTPFYWLFPSEKTLLFLQPFIILSAMLPLFLIGYRKTKSIFFSLVIIFAYSFYMPIQYTIFYDFHPLIFLPPLFAWMYWFFETNKKKLVILFLLLLLLIQEEVGFFVAMFGIYLFIFEKKWRWFGFVLTIIGMAYSLAMMYFIMPGLDKNSLLFHYGTSGTTPIDVLVKFAKDPVSIFKQLFDSPIKRDTLNRTFWPFAYLPLFSPLGLLLSLEQFLSRFLDKSHPYRWSMSFHYSGPMSVVVAIGTICTVSYIGKLFTRHRKLWLVLLGILLIVLTRLEQKNTSIILQIKRPGFWVREAWMDNIDKAVSLVPKNACVAAQNNILPHLSQRDCIYPIIMPRNAEYFLYDLHPGQRGFNFFADEKSFDVKIYERQIKKDIASGIYKVIFNKNDAYLLKKLHYLIPTK